MTAGLVLPFACLAAAQKQLVWQHEDTTPTTKSEALLVAIYLAVDSQQKSTMAVFLTDALSVLQALTNNKLPHLAKALQFLSNKCRVTIQWIPAKFKVPGNKQADTLAKQTCTNRATSC